MKEVLKKRHKLFPSANLGAEESGILLYVPDKRRNQQR